MRPNLWLPLLVIAWGVVTTLTGLVQSFAGLVVVRMALGLCEGGLLPGMVCTHFAPFRTLARDHDAP